MKTLVLVLAVVSVAVAVPQFKPYRPITYEPGSVPVDPHIPLPVTGKPPPPAPVRRTNIVNPLPLPRPIEVNADANANANTNAKAAIANVLNNANFNANSGDGGSKGDTNRVLVTLPPPAPVQVSRVPSYSGGESSGDGKWKIITKAENLKHDGSYKYNYETENGIGAQEVSVPVNLGQENEGKSATGSYSYTAPDGNIITVTYNADENGFQPQGVHLPTPPPIPEIILRALKYIEDHPPPPEGSARRP